MAETEEEREKLREGLLDQLGHLIRETEELEGVIGRVPGRLLAERPPGEALSIKQTYGLLALLDEQVHGLRLERILADEEPRFDLVDPKKLAGQEPWGDRSIADILTRVQEARRNLISAFEAVPDSDWLRGGHFPSRSEKEGGMLERRDLYEMAHAICLGDTQRLRQMSQRLYESSEF